MFYHEEKIQIRGSGLCKLRKKWKRQSKKSRVNDANVSFMMQKMTVDAEDDKFDAIMEEVVRVCAKVEPDCKILMK